MDQRLAHISVHQTSKVIAIAYALLGVIFIPIFWLASFADPTEAFPSVFALLFPIFYGVAGYLFTALFCVFYNWVAGWTGGVEVRWEGVARDLEIR